MITREAVSAIASTIRPVRGRAEVMSGVSRRNLSELGKIAIQLIGNGFPDCVNLNATFAGGHCILPWKMVSSLTRVPVPTVSMLSAGSERDVVATGQSGGAVRETGRREVGVAG